MWLPAKLAVVCVLGSLVACDASGHSASAPARASAPATPLAAATSPSPSASAPTSLSYRGPAIPRPDVLRFRRGLIDNTGWHGTRDARLYPDGRLAVLTYGDSCPLKPVLLTVENASHIDLSYGSAPGEGTGCLSFLAPYTAVLKLPGTVHLNRPLTLTVHFASGDDYTLTARDR
jgi:hypothetical protein